VSSTDELIKHLIVDSNCSVCHEAADRLGELDAEIINLRARLELVERSNAELLAKLQGLTSSDKPPG